MIEKDKRIRIPELLAAARDAPCMACGVQNGTIVAAHGPKSLAGGGMGTKPDDYAVAYLCHDCHAQVDGRDTSLAKHHRADMWTRAHLKTQQRWWRKGIVILNRR